MKLPGFLCAMAFLLAPIMARSDEPIKVDLKELIRHPKKYDGKRVAVTGYWVTNCAHCSQLYPSFEAEQKNPLSGRWIELWGLARNAKIPKAFYRKIGGSYLDYDGYVRVVGTFKYTPIPNDVGEVIYDPSLRARGPVHESLSEPRSRGEIERAIVKGWNGTPEKQITAITEMDPLGPEIPSKIEAYLRKESTKPPLPPPALDRPQPVHH